MENVPWGKSHYNVRTKKMQFCIWAFLTRNVNCKMCQLRFALLLPAQRYLICSFVSLYIHTTGWVNEWWPSSMTVFSKFFFLYFLYFTSSQVLVSTIPLAWYSFWNFSFVKCCSEGLQNFSLHMYTAKGLFLKTLLSPSRTTKADPGALRDLIRVHQVRISKLSKT